ncbi:unnamed protein product [Closterium sp. Naga37s-1]|nr:unnamed protein product [Closterium sp. Naga37s-1]
MTHGRQPHGCLLPALLTTRSARGGRFGQGAEARRRHSRGVERCGMEAALQSRRWHFSRVGATSVEEAARPARGEAEEREGVVDGLDEGMHDWDAQGGGSGSMEVSIRGGGTSVPKPALQFPGAVASAFLW